MRCAQFFYDLDLAGIYTFMEVLSNVLALIGVFPITDRFRNLESLWNSDSCTGRRWFTEYSNSAISDSVLVYALDLL